MKVKKEYRGGVGKGGEVQLRCANDGKVTTLIHFIRIIETPD